MDGIINVLKPAGMTSFDVVAQVRKICKIKKVGHTGTLDPDAVGVLPICVGKATRMVQFLMEDHKFYRGEVTLGIETDTLDATGEVLIQNEVGEILPEKLEKVLNQFRGSIQQIPPMVSALKHEGKRLYELARKGIEVEREPRNVQIYKLRSFRVQIPRFWIDVECSKGTYIRTLAQDIGRSLGCGAHLSYLIRTGTGQFSLEDSVTLQEIQQAAQENRLSDVILPIDWGIRSLPKVTLQDRAVHFAVNGSPLRKGNYQDYPNGLQTGDRVRVYGSERFISLSEVIDGEEQVLKPVKVFA